MKIYIYDIEVTEYDWIVVAKNIETKVFTVIHNDNHHLRSFLDQPGIVLGGFNNKFYDDWVVMTMYQGGSNVEVKKHNDFIIKENRNAWEFPFIQYKKRPFYSFDLRDDISDENISLKASEGNLRRRIVESGVSFDIDRPLTTEELEDFIKYCKEDVDSTECLYYERKEDYIDAKIMVGEMYGVPPEEAIGLTNAKLSAKVLEAKYVKRDDERNYVIPDNIDVTKIPKVVLDFFMLIRDKSIPDEKLFGAGKGKKGMTLKLWIETAVGKCPVTFAWGGVHGAKPCVTVEETEDRVIVNQDVGSLYPNSMINFGYCSRSMKDPEAYIKLVKKRLAYKKAGDKLRANALKLVVNTVYGAMLNLHNDLADRWAGRSVCISNQLAMMMLITQLAEQCKTIDFVNINTDGIMFTIDRKEEQLSEAIIATWCEITRFEMERDDFVKVIQKDVNNYIGIKADGSFKTKGGFVSLYEGGNFKTNSLSIIHKAVVDNLVKGIDPEKTINECNDIFAFQNIIKTGGTYEGSYHYVNGELTPIQKVNRVYAVKDHKYGAVVKRKWVTHKNKKDKTTEKMVPTPVDPYWQEDTISECPNHCFIDNENVLTVDDLDKDYYIDMAKRRIDKYINIDSKVERELLKIKEVVSIMATSKATETTKAPLNIYGKLIEARRRFLEANVKKSGINRYAEFKYFTLEDIIPIKQSIFQEIGLSDVIEFGAGLAQLTLINVDNPEEKIYFTSPLAEDESLIKNPIQKLGAVQTYVRRYLYMLMLDIVEADTVDAVSDKPDTEKKESVKSNKPASPEKREEAKKELINEGGEATEVQVKSIKNGLKKLRDKSEDYEPYIKEIVGKIKSGLKKSEAEEILIEIGNKVTE